MPSFDTPEEKSSSENIVGKGVNAGNQHFLLFPQCFLLYECNIKMSSANIFNFDKAKILSSGKELRSKIQDCLAIV